MPDYDQEAFRRNIDRANSFWQKDWEHFLGYLYLEKVPLFVSERHQQPIFSPEKKGAVIVQARYWSKNGSKVKTKWLSIEELAKKEAKEKLICWCAWTFLPTMILPHRTSIEPKKQKYVYLMRVSQIAYEEKIKTEYTIILETSWDGSVIKRLNPFDYVKSGNKSGFQVVRMEEFPYKFAYPKRIVAKINRCIANYFWVDLWHGPNYASWHHSKEGISTYMVSESLIGSMNPSVLTSLLEASEAATVLISYTCFSILKPFFPSYHKLDRHVPYLEAKKYIPQQLAINIRSNDPEHAINLAKCCCGFFESDKMSIQSIVDGILIRSDPNKRPKLGVNEYESTILQPASILWVNRRPVIELEESGQILDLYEDNGIDDDLLKDVSKVVGGSLASEIGLQSEKFVRQYLFEMRDKATPIVEKFLDSVESCLNVIEYRCDNVDFSKERGDLRQNLTCMLHRCELTIKFVSRIICDELKEYEDRCKYSTPLKYQKAREKIEILERDALKELRAVHRTIKRQQCTFDAEYKKAIDRLRRDAEGALDIKGIKQIAYLSASFRVFMSSCLSGKKTVDQEALCARLDRILIDTLKHQVGYKDAQDILESYLLRLIRESRYARIRGVESNRAKIGLWYDAKRKLFLLPTNTYFGELNRYNYSGLTQSAFEKELEDRKLIRCTERKNRDIPQKRRSFEVVVGSGQKKISVLEIYQAKLSERFLQEGSVAAALENMKNDPTSLRGKK